MLTNEQLVQYTDMSVMMKAAKDLHADMKHVVDADFSDMYVERSIKSRDAIIDGEKVASLTWVPGRVPERRDVIEPVDRDALMAWAEEHGYVTKTVDMEKVQKHLSDTGELADGCEIRTIETGGKRGYVKVTPDKSYRAAIEGRVRAMMLLGGPNGGE